MLDGHSKTLAEGSRPFVERLGDACDFVSSELLRLRPGTACAVVDGPFLPADDGAKVRQVERLFQSGPFAATPLSKIKLRINPASTSATSKFLVSTRSVLTALDASGLHPPGTPERGVLGPALEIFPTLFMASMLEPHAYEGKRREHTDALWRRWVQQHLLHADSPLHPFSALIARADAAPPTQRHDMRMAVVCAIAACWHLERGATTASGCPAEFIGNAKEHGFLLPPADLWNASFRAMTVSHWEKSAPLGLEWCSAHDAPRLA